MKKLDIADRLGVAILVFIIAMTVPILIKVVLVGPNAADLFFAAAATLAVILIRPKRR